MTTTIHAMPVGNYSTTAAVALGFMLETIYTTAAPTANVPPTSGWLLKICRTHKRYKIKYILVLLTTLHILTSPLFSIIAGGQTVLPNFTSQSIPVPSPLPPGDIFSPLMNGPACVTAPICAEWTRTASPNESLVITGIHFSNYTGLDEGKDTKFLLFDGSSTAKTAEIQRVTGNKAIITLAQGLLPWRMYLAWPGNETGYGAPIAINQTDAWWVGPNKATRGDTISVYGRNLAHENDTLVSYVYIKPATSSGQWATVVKVNPYKVAFKVPANLVNGTYEVWTHNGHGGQYGWSGPLALTVGDGVQWSSTILNVKSYGAVGNGSADDTQAIRNALLAAKQNANSTIYFPAGTYMISNSLEPNDNTRWTGDGKYTTILKCAPNFSNQAQAFIYGAVHNIEINNLTFDSGGNYTGIQPEPIFLRGSTDVKLNNLVLYLTGSNTIQLDNSTYCFISRCEVVGMTSFLGHASQLFISNCHFKLTNDTEMALDSWGGSNISLTNSTCRDLDNSNPNDGAGWGKGRFYAGRGNFGSSSMTYIGNNATFDLAVRPIGPDPNSGEQYLWEGYTAHWTASVLSSTSNVTVLSGNQNIYTSDTHHAVIISGTGIGQSRKVTSYTANSITLDKPWNLPPDNTSIIAIANANDRTVLYKNYIDGKVDMVNTSVVNASAGIEPYGTTLNFIADHNTLHEVRYGIANWATQNDSTTIDPNYFSFYANNIITHSRYAILNGLDMHTPKSDGMIGTMYRGNNIQDVIQTAIFNTTVNGGLVPFNGFVYEHNNIIGSLNGFTADSSSISNQILYDNTFLGLNAPNSFGIKKTLNVALRENTFRSFVNPYASPSPSFVIEAPLHVIEMHGSVGTDTISTNFVLWNSGTASMNWTAVSNSSWLTLPVMSGTIPDEWSTSVIELKANPAGMLVGSYSATITVTSNNENKKYTILFIIKAASTLAVTVVAPFNNSVFPTNSYINIIASTAIQPGVINKVTFFVDTVKIGETSTSPYHFMWNNTATGSHFLIAKAVSSTGLTTTSVPVHILISNPLSISLLSFTAQQAATSICLRWVTTNEQQNSSFLVERSLDGYTYTTLVSLPGQGTSIGQHNYTWSDTSPATGTNYYRLQQSDSGVITYSPVVAVEIKAGQAFGEPYPSPACCYLTLLNLPSANVPYRIFNSVSGTLLRGTTGSGIAIDIQLLPTGLYYIELNSMEKYFIRKFVKL